MEPQPCRELLVFSWAAEPIESHVECPDPCECAGQLTWVIREFFGTEMRPAVCDETAGLPQSVGLGVPDGLNHVLRANRPCEDWAGYHTGRVDLGIPGAPFSGVMNGVDGLSPENPEQCCSLRQSRGVLVATVDERAERLVGCSIHAAYVITYSQHRFDDRISPCETERWKRWRLQLTGVLDCPCPQ